MINWLVGWSEGKETVTTAAEFRRLYLLALLRDGFQFHSDNYDARRHGPLGPVQLEPLLGVQEWLLDHCQGLAETYDGWADDGSRNLMMRLLSFRSLGHHHVKLPTNTPEYKEYSAKAYALPESAVPGVRFSNWQEVAGKKRMILELEASGTRLLSGPGFLVNGIFFHQYELRRGALRIGPNPGDVLIDMGAYAGDNAVLFAEQVGPQGAVYAFEFLPEMLPVVEYNRQLNPALTDRIHIVPHPVGERPGQVVRYQPAGPATRVGAGSAEALTESLDNLVRAQHLPRVDFIKMDVEGSEAAALMGATETIRRFGPRLAISIYHRISDWVELPRLIRAIEPRYKLYLDHHTIHGEESVLYATLG